MTDIPSPRPASRVTGLSIGCALHLPKWTLIAPLAPSHSSPLSLRQNLAKKRFLYYWAPFNAWRIGNDWETATAIAASANGDRAHCPSKVSRLHTASASGGWNESALLSVTCS